MPMLPIHSELEKAAKGQPAGYIDAEVFARVTLERLRATVALMKGQPFSAGTGVLSGSLNSLKWVSNPTLSLVPAKVAADGEVDILYSSGFTILIDIFLTSDPTKLISKVTLDVSNARAHVRAENNLIILEGADFDSKTTITRRADAEKILQAAGIDLVEATRVEGLIGYGVATNALRKSLAERLELPLASIFAVVNFGPRIKLAILNKGASLGIIPTDKVTVNVAAHCQCKEGTDFQITKTTITKTVPAAPKANDAIAKIELGGPMAEKLDPLKHFGPRPVDQKGFAGLYIPESFAKKLIGDPLPAIVFPVASDGFIKVKGDVSVAFSAFKVTFDEPHGGLLLRIDFRLSISLSCYITLFCVDIWIGTVIIQPAGGSPHMLLGFYPSVNNSGVLALKGTLKESEVGSYICVVVGIGSFLSAIGIGAFLGYLVDVILSGIVSLFLPGELQKRLREVIGTNEWKFLEAAKVRDPNKTLELSAPFNAGKNSLLASVGYYGRR